MFEPIKYVAYAVIAICVSYATVSDCYATPTVSQVENDEAQQLEDHTGATMDHEKCPETYQRYIEMEQKYHRPQLWQGCDGAYDIDTVTQVAEEPETGIFVLNLFNERHSGDTRASGLSVIGVSPQGFIFGLNAEQISSSKVVNYDGQQDTLYSLYGFAGLTMNTPISPYIEIGVDLGDTMFVLADSILQDALGVDGCVLVDRNGNCETVDVFLASGVQNQPTKNAPFIRAYAKWYAISHDSNDSSLPVFGFALGWSF